MFTRTQTAAIANAMLAVVNEYVKTLKREGKQVCFDSYEVEMGAKHARFVGVRDGGDRSAQAWLCADGMVRKSKSWKGPSKTIITPLGGRTEAMAAIRAIVGPVLSGA